MHMCACGGRRSLSSVISKEPSALLIVTLSLSLLGTS